jgi:hypothetical protein
MFKKLMPFCLATLLFTGCTSVSITNLTPSQQPRNASGLYPFEVKWDSNQQSVVNDTIKVSVQIGMDEYPMQKTPLMKNRWETLIPVPTGKNYLSYNYKFVYDYRSIPQRRQDSKMSTPYHLHIIDK